MRRRGDMGAFREAIRGPGMDTREWVCVGRIDVDPDATVWDDILGWLCDVTAQSGPMAGTRLPLPCRMISSFQGDDAGEHNPPHQGALVLVVFPSGDPNEDAIILGELHNEDDAGAPAEVNGDTIVETNASTGQVAADVTHIVVAPGRDLDQQWRHVRITGTTLVLGAADADQPFVRGDDYADALGDFADALATLATALNTAIIGAGGAGDAAAVAQFQAAVATVKNAREHYLSQRIVGD